MATTTTPHRTVAPALAPGTLSLSFDDYHTSDPEGATEATPSRTPPLLGKALAAGLPTEVMQEILYLTDPETFASLVLVSRAWRKAAEDPQIYAHHLAQCPSYSGAQGLPTGPFQEEDLQKFKKQLLQEVKRNLFAAFLRPHQTIINLISTTTSSSAAFPYGEGFEFSFSHRAQYCLAISSSRIIVIDTAADTPRVMRELKVVRRPLSACILADGSLLVVLAANHRVNLYDLTREHAMFKRSIELDETAHTITMTMGGEILAAGCEGGVEVVSLAETGPQAVKRVIKCDRVDHLAFSTDGTMLLGTTHPSRSPSTVILTAPYFTDFSEHEMDQAELLSHLWTSQIIFPNSSRDCSHAALLPRNSDHDSNWTLAYDRVFESFRAVRTDDLRNGTTYFTGPEPNLPSPQQQEWEQRQREQERNRRPKISFTPKTLPAITPEGELVAAAFLTSDIWLYGVPEDLEHPGVKDAATRIGLPASNPSSPRSSLRAANRLPRWQLLVDKYRNVFAKGRKVASVTGASTLCWCSPDPAGTEHKRERLVIAAPGGVSDYADLPEQDLASVDGGRLVLLDFNLGSVGGETSEITIEVGNAEPELLEEENMDMDEEIAVVRRRTLARQEGASRLTVSSVADVLRPAALDNVPPVPPFPAATGFGLDRTGTDESTVSQETAASPEEATDEMTIEEAIEGLDGPYSHTAPRSRGTVYRSAAAVEANRRRNPTTPGTTGTTGPVEFRRTDGTELPHESDADNWVPPPPAYGEHIGDDRPPQENRRFLSPSHSLDTTSRNIRRSFASAAAPAISEPEASRSIRESIVSAAAPGLLEPESQNIRHSLVSAPSPGLAEPETSRNIRLSLVSAASPGLLDPSLASPVSLPSPNVIPRRPVGSPTLLRQSSESRRRSSADIEGTRWFSRHQDNRSASPALSDDDAFMRNPNQWQPPPGFGSSPPRRPISNYTPRSSLYRAALQPPTSIDTIPEPEIMATRTPRRAVEHSRESTSTSLTGTDLQQRLAEPLPLPPATSVAPVTAPRDRSVSPLPRDETDASGPHSQRVSEPQSIPRSIPPSSTHSSARPEPEPSAWHSNTVALATAPIFPPAATSSNRTSQRLLGFSRRGASHSERGNDRPRSPLLSTAIDMTPDQTRAQRSVTTSLAPLANESTFSSNGSSAPDAAPTPTARKRRSMRFRRRPKTEDPAVLAAAAPPLPRASNALPTVSGEAPGTFPADRRIGAFQTISGSATGTMTPNRAPARGHAQTRSLVEPPTTMRRGWERAPHGDAGIAPIDEAAAVPMGGARAPSGRKARMFSRVPPGAEAVAVSGGGRSATGRGQVQGAEQGSGKKKGGKCVVM